MARRDVCARSAEAPAVAEDMLLRLAIAAYARHAESGPALDSQLLYLPPRFEGEVSARVLFVPITDLHELGRAPQPRRSAPIMQTRSIH